MGLFNWFAKNTLQTENQMTQEDVQRVIEEFKKSSLTIQEQPEVLEEISFDKVISYFKSDRPENANVKHLAIIRQKYPEAQPENQCLTLVFLDETNHLVCLPSGVPSGRTIVVKNFDKKLSKFLGDRDFSVVDLNQISIFVKAIKIASIIIWTLVILLVLFPLLGRLIMTQALAAELNPPTSLVINSNMVAFWGSGNQNAFDQARQTAYKEAQEYAEQELDQWEAELINRLDTDFLDWYFNYFNQKAQELNFLLSYIGDSVLNKFNFSTVNDKIKNRINDNINREFARRVINSKSAESKFKNIVFATTKMYVEKLSGEVKNVPRRYKVSEVDWNQYLESIKFRLENEKDGESLPVKIIGGYVTTKMLAKFAAKTGSKAVTSFLSSSIASIIDPAVGLGLIAWDYWDYTNGVEQNKPRLRDNLVESLHQIKQSLVNDPESGVMSAVNELDEQIKNSV